MTDKDKTTFQKCFEDLMVFGHYIITEDGERVDPMEYPANRTKIKD